MKRCQGARGGGDVGSGTGSLSRAESGPGSSGACTSAITGSTGFGLAADFADLRGGGSGLACGTGDATTIGAAAGDPVWTADGVVSERWLPVSPNGRLDGFTWKLPLAEIGVTRPVIEVVPPSLRPAAEPIAVAPPVPQARPEPPPRKSVKSAAKPKPVEPVIPLVHAPDDPG